MNSKRSDQFSDNLLKAYLKSLLSNRARLHFVRENYIDPFRNLILEKDPSLRSRIKDISDAYSVLVVLKTFRHAIDTNHVPDNILDEIREFSISNL